MRANPRWPEVAVVLGMVMMLGVLALWLTLAILGWTLSQLPVLR